MTRNALFLNIIGLFILIFILAGCAASTQERPFESEDQDAVPSEGSEIDDSELIEQVYVDVYAIGGDDWRDSWNPEVRPPARFDLTSRGSDEGVVSEDSLEMVQGFRIQLADVLTHGAAIEIQDAARERFSHVYVTFRSPNYKIRAGNYQNRGQAESYLSDARSLGFRNAWIVPDWVFVNPPALVMTASDSLEAGLIDEDGVLIEQPDSGEINTDTE
ncbi:MAG TPA: SPOR domain-containing protein [Bacteroidetes bacterium]|nr:hypothetical protein BMS3Bbin04_01250 [bacterium BMS3Bbin04]HDO65758.1 SPOR domain-containing protein [Bacteroidota bacterium]HEX04883.1 SPOR domain-containing protein [Bacteroidota bacterium]